MGELATHEGRECWTFEQNSVEFRRADREVDGGSGHNISFVRFHAPNPKLFIDFDHFDNRANRSFMARVYSPEGPASEVVLMFNGLDETLPQLGTEDRM